MGLVVMIVKCESWGVGIGVLAVEVPFYDLLEVAVN